MKPIHLIVSTRPTLVHVTYANESPKLAPDGAVTIGGDKAKQSETVTEVA